MTRRDWKMVQRVAAGSFEGVGFMTLLLGACAMDSEDITIPLTLCIIGLVFMLIGVLVDKIGE